VRDVRDARGVGDAKVMKGVRGVREVRDEWGIMRVRRVKGERGVGDTICVR
jgi:hypothetical protein